MRERERGRTLTFEASEVVGESSTIWIYIYICIYIYIKRERVKKRERILTFEASEVVGESYTFLLSAISLQFICMDILSMPQSID